MSYRIAQAAQLSGVPATTIRYYEGQGVLRPADRAPNGYRTYDDRDVARLRFVDRVRALELPPDDLAELVELWERDRCAPIADRLRDHVAERLAETRRRIAVLADLAGDLRRVQARLDRPPHDGPCLEGRCALLDEERTVTSLPLVEGRDASGEPIACSLHPDRVADRLEDWQRLLVHAVAQEPIAGGLAFRFPIDPDLAGRLVALAAAEQGCCRFLDLTLRVTADALRLEVTGPPDARPVIDLTFAIDRRTDEPTAT